MSTLRARWGRALPTPEQTLLLRACLLPGDAGHRAWDSWLAAAPDPLAAFRRYDAGYLRLGSLLATSLRRQGIDVRDDLGGALRAAAIREEGRTERFEAVIGPMLQALEAERVPAAVVGGAALAATVYPRPALRHCHDLDLLVEPGVLERTVGVLRGAGSASRPADQPGDAEVVDPSGVPASVHTRLAPIGTANIVGTVLSRTVPIQVAGVPCRGLARDDALLHASTKRFGAPRGWSIQWAADAHHVLAGDEPDWDRLVDTALEAGLSVPLSIGLGYLRSELDAQVPPAVLDALDAAASADVDGQRRALASLPRPVPLWRKTARRLPAPVRRVLVRIRGT